MEPGPSLPAVREFWRLSEGIQGILEGIQRVFRVFWRMSEDVQGILEDVRGYSGYFGGCCGYP